jgi:hypothetical protein
MSLGLAMQAPVSESNPFLAIARYHKIAYGVVLSFADWMQAGATRVCGQHDHYWWRQARAVLSKHPHGGAIADDIVLTCRRLGQIAA